MSNGQWEVVGKNKKSLNGKLKKDEDKKTMKNAPKLEETVSNSQIKSIYSGMTTEHEDKKSKDNKKKENTEKKNKKAEKKVETPKSKPHKTIKAACESIDVAELENVVATNKLRFTNAPLVWLKEIASFLNSKSQIEVDDPTFSNSPQGYPLTVLPPEVKNVLVGVLHDAGKANAQLFYDITLTAFANDMSRAVAVNGHRLLLQLMAEEYPEFCAASLPKSVSLRNSYQNRPPIGLSLLWALGQGGIKDFSVGCKVWQEIFLPVIDFKHYAKYVVSYLDKLIEGHTSENTACVNHDQLILMFEAINSKRNSVSKEISSDLIKLLTRFKDIYLNSAGNKLQVTFNQLMKKLPNQYLHDATLDPYHGVMVDCLVECLQREDSCHISWRQLLQKCNKQSTTLLSYIDSNWKEVSSKLKLKSLKAMVLQFQEISGEALKGKKKEDTMVKANKICQDILERMKSSKRFPWFKASFVLLLSIVGLVAYDVSRVNGNFPKSATGQLLKDVGMLEHSQLAWQKTLSTSARGYLWLENNVPIYYSQTVDICKPYLDLSKDVYLVVAKKTGLLYGNVKDYVAEKAPVVGATVEEYVPGLIESVQSYAGTAWTAVKKYTNEYFKFTSEYLRSKVFVGEWAPEVLQNKTETALNVTRHRVSSYFHWLREQANVYSKIP